MAQPSKATPETVLGAIERIVARGERVTLNGVKDEIGGGSLGTIQPLVKAWKSKQDEAARDQAAQQTQLPEEPASIPVRVSQALDTGRTALENVATAVADAINTAVADERRRGRLELETERDTWERRIADAQEQTKSAEDETSQVAADAAAIEIQRDELLERLAAAEAGRDRLADELTAEREARQLAQGTADQHAAELVALRETVVQAEARVASAEQRAAQAEAEKVKAEAAHAAADEERRQVVADSRSTIEKITAERDQVRQELAAAVGTGDALRSDLDRSRASAEQLQQRVTILEGSAEKLTAERDQVRQQLAVAEAAGAAAKDDLARVRDRADQLQERVIKLEASEASATALAKERLEQREAMKTELTAARQALAKPGKPKST